MQNHSLTCTFCRKSEHQVRKLVAGPGVYICDVCVEVAHRIVSAEGPPPAQDARWRRVTTRVRGVFAAALRRIRLQGVGIRHAV